VPQKRPRKPESSAAYWTFTAYSFVPEGV